MNVTNSPSPESDQIAKKARILYVITKGNWGGAQKYVYDLATAAETIGHMVDVAVGVEGEMTEKLMRAHIPVLSVPGLGRDISIGGDVKAFLSLLRLMRAIRPDVVHGNSSKAGLLGTVVARISGVPRIIFTAHGWAFNETRPSWQKGIFAIFHLLTVLAADKVICVSEGVRRDAEWMAFGLASIKLKFVVIHNGIDEVKLLERGLARASLAPHLPFPLWIGTLAELHPTKGLDVAIKAFAQIASRFPDTALVLIGEGQQRKELEALAKKFHVSDRVRFCGHVANAPSFLSAFDIFLFPSRSEALGFAALEAGNASLPVIASKVGGIPEIIEDGVSGMLVSPNDTEAFVSNLATLLENPELRIQLGQALQQRVMSDFTKAQMISQTLRSYLVN